MLKKIENRQWDEVRSALLEMHQSEAADDIEKMLAGGDHDNKGNVAEGSDPA